MVWVVSLTFRSSDALSVVASLFCSNFSNRSSIMVCTFTFVANGLVTLVSSNWTLLRVVITTIYSSSTIFTTITYCLGFVAISLDKVPSYRFESAFAICPIWFFKFCITVLLTSVCYMNLVDALAILVITSVDDATNLLNTSSHVSFFSSCWKSGGAFCYDVSWAV